MITFLHISDLHIGATPYHQNFFQKCHGFGIAQDLARFWNRWMGSYRNPKIIVSGDLTHAGGGLEFGNTHRFLHSQWRVGTKGSQKVGLNSNGDVAFTVPGNHDFWNGVFMSQPNVYTPALDSHFASLPWVEVIEDANSNLEVHLVGLDSCSGLNQVSWNQFIAVGAIDMAQLKTASVLLNNSLATAQNKSNDVLRVVVLHHPPQDLFNSAQFTTWLTNNNIEIILTGHTHTPSVPSSLSVRPLILGCGSTTQAGHPYKPPLKGNHFYIHSIVQRVRSSVDWETSESWYTGASWTSMQPVWKSPNLKTI